jgi:hypothetical protein
MLRGVFGVKRMASLRVLMSSSSLAVHCALLASAVVVVLSIGVPAPDRVTGQEDGNQPLGHWLEAQPDDSVWLELSHTLTRLPDGTVLAAGVGRGLGSGLRGSSIYDPRGVDSRPDRICVSGCGGGC